MSSKRRPKRAAQKPTTEPVTEVTRIRSKAELRIAVQVAEIEADIAGKNDADLNPFGGRGNLKAFMYLAHHITRAAHSIILAIEGQDRK